jgi:5'-deoxynucleotidase YfbR-like HD superfamily hydrolase
MKPVIRHESVAEHSYFVALGVVVLSGVYQFDLPLALLTAVCHDVPEMDISDVNHMVKKKYPDVAAAIKMAEISIINNLPGNVKTGAALYDSGSVEAKIVHLADAIQCTQYATSEIRMGNTGYMEEVYANSVERANALHIELKDFRRWK